MSRLHFQTLRPFSKRPTQRRGLNSRARCLQHSRGLHGAFPFPGRGRAAARALQRRGKSRVSLPCSAEDLGSAPCKVESVLYFTALTLREAARGVFQSRFCCYQQQEFSHSDGVGGLPASSGVWSFRRLLARVC